MEVRGQETLTIYFLFEAKGIKKNWLVLGWEEKNRLIWDQEWSCVRPDGKHETDMEEAEISAQIWFSPWKDQEDTWPGLTVISFAFHFSKKWAVTVH